jgi:fluoroquinolone transport system permease protein
MSARLATLLSLDARLQLRYGIYYAYAVVVAFYVVALVWLAPFLPPQTVGLIVYSDPAVLGFFFLGALMMLEKAESARTALAMTPVSAADYVWSKTLTLTAVAVVAVAIIGSAAQGPMNWPVLLAATVLTSVQFIGVGVPIALGFRTVTAYLIGSAGLMLPFVLPAGLALLDPMPAWAIVVPAASQLRLVLIGAGAAAGGAGEIAAMLAVCAIAAAAGIFVGIRGLKREFGK